MYVFSIIPLASYNPFKFKVARQLSKPLLNITLTQVLLALARDCSAHASTGGPPVSHTLGF